MVRLTLKEKAGFIPVAKIVSKDTKMNGEVLFLDPAPMEKAEEPDELDMQVQALDVGPHLKGKKPRESMAMEHALHKHLSKNVPPVDEDLASAYRSIKDRASKNFQLKTGTFVPLPNVLQSRTVWYLFGASGSGKSYLSASIIRQWMKLNKGDVFVFSKLDDDKVIDDLGPRLHRVDTATLVEPMDISEIPDGSMVLYDDIDTETDKRVYQNLQDLLNQVLQIGRHKKISCIVTSHLASDYKRTRIVLNESHYLIVYPQSGSFYQIEYLLKKYGGLSTADIKRVKGMISRWACIYRHYPQYVLGEQECFLLSQ